MTETAAQEIQLQEGTIHYREAGSGEPIVLVHGLLADSQLWREVVPLLAREYRVIAPDWPLGSHRIAMSPTTDLSPLGLAKIIADFLEALELDRVTLVGNDTGGAICQLVAVNHPQRLARLVLTPCDAYENFLPPAFRPLQKLARSATATAAILQSMRLASARKAPLAYGWLSKRADDDLTLSWIEPALNDKTIRAQLSAVLTAIDQRYTLQAAERFGEFTKPVLLAWAPEDRFFKLRYAERLAQAFPDARLELIEDSYTFVPIDQPQRTAALIAAFAREPAAVA
ncbi:MAG TPA: alpha/beta hydrolase [Solirubrobacteraceae bacterium]|jgi:pimeloyl-ACP methyl ester carboxylesterase|nr:alpha/beta hydrolase [Solirubrobacteraceae bacterium]